MSGVFERTNERVEALREAIATKGRSCVDVVGGCLEVAEAHHDLNAMICLDRRGALRRAAALDRDDVARELPLGGVVLSVKDNFCTRELPTTCASKMLAGYRSAFESTATERLREAGAVVIGKANMDEFAMGSTSETSVFGPCRNPLSPDRCAGGSSGGSAASVAAGFCHAALATDTGGSVRLPAAYCGVVGFRPSYGRISRSGMIAYASSLDQAGILASSVRDIAAVYRVVAGWDANDATSSRESVGVVDFDGCDLAGVRVGAPDIVDWEACEGSVRSSLEAVHELLRARGATLVPLSMPYTARALDVYYVIACAEASSNLARYDGVRFGHRSDAKSGSVDYRATRGEGFGPEVRRRILLGTYVLSEGYRERFYEKALGVRHQIGVEYERAFRSCDCICTPVCPATAPRLGELIRPLDVYRSDRFTVGPSLAGIPSLSLPVGSAPNGLPTAIQLVAPRMKEARLLRLAHALELATDASQ